MLKTAETSSRSEGPASLHVIDSHTAGEPTRTVVGGLPDLGGGSVAEQRVVLSERADWVRRSIILEPRGSDVMVGAALVPAREPDCVCGVIFFNNTGYLNMCGHGMIGVAETLRWQGRLSPGRHRFETPVGVVAVEMSADGRVCLENVPSYRWRRGVSLTLSDGTVVVGDVAWGGNWFYLVQQHGQVLHWDERSRLCEFTESIRRELEVQGIRGRDGGEIDHIELVSPAAGVDADLVNFVLCPGLAFDRSPCGTGCSAKVACLAAGGDLEPGQRVRIAGISGEFFEVSYQAAGSSEQIEDRPLGGVVIEGADGPVVIPKVVGRAYVNGKTEVLFDPRDPFCFGLVPGEKLVAE